jgi:ATP-dependent RNA helicase DDX19/DBP5
MLRNGCDDDDDDDMMMMWCVLCVCLALKTTGLDEKNSTVIVEGCVGGIYSSAATWADLKLPQPLLQAIASRGFAKPSKIQAQALPMILAKEAPNIIGQAHAGSGKTAAFSLGMLCKTDEKLKAPQGIVICPTRELARQIADEVRQLAKYTQIRVAEIIPDVKRRRITEQICVGTPGTLKGFIQKKLLALDNVRIFIADEADFIIKTSQMADTTTAIKKLIARAKQKKQDKHFQILLFSATFAKEVRKFAGNIASNALRIIVKKEALVVKSIQQFQIVCPGEKAKYTTLNSLYENLTIGQGIICVNARATAQKLTKQMRADGHTVSVIHGGREMKSSQRDQVMKDFREGQSTVLIATDVLARGVDVPAVNIVINYEIPFNYESKTPDPSVYLHRIGRAGRFGRLGVAITLVHDERSAAALGFIESYFKHKTERLVYNDVKAISTKISSALAVAESSADTN